MKSMFGLLFGSVLPFAAADAAAQDPVPVPATTKAVKAVKADKADKAAKPVYDEAADARAEVAAAVARAKKANRRVLIQWGANWCGWCKWLAGTMQSDAEVRAKLNAEYDVVHVDVGRFDKNKDLAKELGAEFQSIPYLTILGGDGKAIVQQNTEPFETKIDGQGGHDPKKLLEFLTSHQAEPRVATEVRDAAFAKAKAEHKLVFVHFGAPWCGWCHRLEDWMARPEIAALLGKEFVDLEIDTERMTGGDKLYAEALAAAKVEATGIPWFAFCDADGAQLAVSEMPGGGTIGFPYKPEEVAAFAAMLAKVHQRLSGADIAALTASLHGIREADAKKQAAAGR